MHHVTDRASNPFGMRAPCEEAVYGYGDPNADFHVVGDHPGVHGGFDAGRPFGDTESGQRLLSVLADVGFVDDPSAEDPAYDELFTSYRYMCAPQGGRAPSAAEYERLERYFDAELRAINAHVLLPVGERATRAVLAGYTTQAHKVDGDVDALHATEIRGRGFMVVPVADPSDWDADARSTIRSKLESVRSSDYRQTKGVGTLVG